MIIQYFRLLFVLFLFCVKMEATPSSPKPSVKKKLSLISKEDSEILDQLFRSLVFEDYFAYTLFGSKPMTHKGTFCSVLTRKRSKANESDYIFLTCWKVWKKYASLPEFQTPNFAFVEKKCARLCKSTSSNF